MYTNFSVFCPLRFLETLKAPKSNGTEITKFSFYLDSYKIGHHHLAVDGNDLTKLMENKLVKLIDIKMWTPIQLFQSMRNE